MRFQRWEHSTKRRYYEMRVIRNLFNDWELFLVWGGIGSNLGNTQSLPATTFDHAMTMLNKQTKTRKGYG